MVQHLTTITLKPKTPMICSTKGDGHWSSEERAVITPKIQMEMDMGEVEELLTDAGYTFETRKIPWEELDRTATMRKLRKDLESGEADPEKMQPYRIAARKRLNA